RLRRQHQRNQLILRKLGQIIASHPILESHRDSRVNQYLAARRPFLPYPSSTRVDQLLRILHSDGIRSFISSDNPVIYFDPDVSEATLLPYVIDRNRLRIELLFPLASDLMLHGHSNFVGREVLHMALRDGQDVKRMNRQVARFGYRFIFANSPTVKPLVKKFAGVSPVLAASSSTLKNGNALLLQMKFDRRPPKPKWKRGRTEPQ
ncbi:MAG: DUF4238 domain-containing protein, partial [Stellaceae bacterium]